MVIFENHVINKQSLSKDIVQLKNDFYQLKIKLTTFEECLNEFNNRERLNELLADLVTDTDYDKLKNLISAAGNINKNELYDYCTELVESFNIFKSDYRELVLVLSEEEPEVVSNMNSYT
ncbi:hypothetical protein TUM19329_27330 [Legionella antarctica]|uniref:Uncharacterized protein n=1 Tax=Legionella antarctica TaxID=2708020 RepID=A0A6F8T8K7_9GAMM|nr:hypothetical protein [Legionella antarctica]BCA96372.1 hypothetical protein TUM19329_27330 [Legionella antarctica]